MTAAGSEELAVEAIQIGAVSYVMKKRLTQELRETVRRTAHTIKGTMRSFEAESVINLAAALEEQGQVRELSQSEKLFHELDKLLEKTIYELRSYRNLGLK
jgi:HPt (histidine-containing phosphotransfer) domain-containing protein